MKKTIEFYSRKLAWIVAVLFFITSCKKDDNNSESTIPWYTETNENGDSILAVYESRIPCVNCERLKFALAIYRNNQTQLPTTYAMTRIYVGNGDDRTNNYGDVSVTYGTSLDSSHTVYLLTSGAPTEYRAFWKINEDLLFILDANLTPMVGDAGHGYVLNRVR